MSTKLLPFLVRLATQDGTRATINRMLMLPESDLIEESQEKDAMTIVAKASTADINNCIIDNNDDNNESYNGNGFNKLNSKQSTNSMQNLQYLTKYNDIIHNKIQNNDYSPSITEINGIDSLDKLEHTIQKFEGCELKKSAKNTVFARGNPRSGIMCIGEAPGAQEDERGIPFCGASGKLLDNIFKSFSIDEPYITNTVFWRPPMNRRPTADELAICRPFVEKHIALCSPQIIIMIGSIAIESLFGAEYKITKIRKRILHYTNVFLDHEIPTVAIFHPAYLLRQQTKKLDMWEDMIWIYKKILSSSISS